MKRLSSKQHLALAAVPVLGAVGLMITREPTVGAGVVDLAEGLIVAVGVAMMLTSLGKPARRC